MSNASPPLYSLTAFEAAGRLNSFKKAGAELNLTPAAVAHQVKNLEQSLNVELFKRHARGVELNQAGQDYLQIVQRFLTDFKLRTQVFKSQYDEQPIRIGALHVVSERIVLPLVQDFIHAFPDVRAELVADLVGPNFLANDLDIMIWHGTKPPENYACVQLMSEMLTPVCAPGLLAKFPDGLTLDDLQNVPALYDLYWQDDWEDWLTYVNGPELTNSLGFSLYSALIQSALNGNGIAIGHTGLLRNELASGQLVKPFKEEVPAPKSYYVVTSDNKLMKRNVRTFWDWIGKTIGQRHGSVL
ncbi:Glycine cleavage system transcriptional activator [Pelagimonas phthalicica]|uniref:Glycine cleavage system transcriptional activator n=1 Tax=Pelagimonas phthalicica TaxID=1037362 RepID=A0A238J893_9RHOB|nr:LysR substrate-binding domain-containing protein [Pelagimonas phthalicica]TDS94866.1 LysR family glycine cleavage system transcriptional activator [Pelagimonas phthalicica]SMX26605.1 Glycine cleavage system transcriptional activator [Pelagimonas phthalicica]